MAASSSSTGTAATNPRSIQIANGRLNARCTSTSDPRWLSPNAGATSRTDRMTKNSGMVSASTGTICTTSSITSSVVRLRNRKRVSAVAARNETNRLSTTTAPATTRLLTR